MNRLFILLLFVIAGLTGCQESEKSQSVPASEATAVQAETELDISRTNPVKNTPSRVGDGEAIYKTSDESSERSILRTADLITELPEGKSVPRGMVFVPGGTFEMGSDQGLPRERPVTRRIVQGFFMDRHPVTIGQFRKFVEATGYRTQAEEYGDAAVFDLEARQWYLQVGAYWEYPRGRSAGPAPDDHPVTQVSWNDVQAYCKWAGNRLPTEAEWEHAARNGRNSRSRYYWGQQIRDTRGNYLANVWQGTFPAYNSEADGYLFTSPVGEFGANELGLTDMSGNVWEWCADWYVSYDPNQPARIQTPEPERAMRGGSFMCDPSYCHGYRVSGRSGSTPETGLFHVGFRTVRDL